MGQFGGERGELREIYRPLVKTRGFEMTPNFVAESQHKLTRDRFFLDYHYVVYPT